MKNVVIIIFLILLSVAAGCSTASSSPSNSNEATSIHEQKIMEDNGISCAMTIDKLAFDSNAPYTLNVDISLKNTGPQAIGLACFTTITDYAGVSTTSLGFGNIDLLYPQSTQSFHDKIGIQNQQYNAILSKNSKLSVKCMSSSPFAKPYANNLKTSWDVTPSNFQ